MIKNLSLDEATICTIKNIADFDFTPELGAMYNSRSFFVKSGEELMAPEPIAYRLAINLAKAMLNKGLKKEEVGKGDDKAALVGFTEDDVENLAQRITVQKIAHDKPVTLTAEQRMEAKIEELNRWKESLEAREKDLTETTDFKDKAQIIAELEEKGVRVDRRKSKEELEKLLYAESSGAGTQ